MAHAAHDSGSAVGGALHTEPDWASRPQQHGASLAAALGSLWTELRGLAREHAVLAVLEAQRAGINFAYLIAAVLVIAVLAVTAWLALVTALILGLAGNGVSWPWVLVIGALLNVVGAAGIALWARKQALHMPFSASLRQLSADRSEIMAGGDHAPAGRP